MSIVITESPDNIATAYRPTIWEMTSDRLSNTTFAVTGVSSGTGGKARYAIASNTLKVGDIVTMEGFSVTAYNVRQTVTVSTLTYIETEIVYAGNSTGNLTRTNDNFQLLGRVYTYENVQASIISVASDPDGLLMTTSSAHGLSTGDYIVVTGTGIYNDLYEILEVPTSTTIVVAGSYSVTALGTIDKVKYLGSKSAKAVAGVFKFNFSNYLKTQLQLDIVALGSITNVYASNMKSIKKYGVRFSEEYDDVSGLLKEGDYIIPAPRQITNVPLQDTDSQNLNAFTVDSSTKLFLTTGPRKRSIVIGDIIQLGFLTSSTPSLRYVIEQYGFNGTLISTLTGTTVPISENKGVLYVDTAGYPSSVASIKVYLDDGSTRKSEIMTYNFTNCCQGVTFWWENKRGAADRFTFTGRQIESIRTTISGYKRDLGSNFSLQDGGDYTLSVKERNRNAVWSEFLNRADAKWVSEIYASPNVFVEWDGQLRRIIPLTDEATIYDQEELIQMIVEYKYSNDPINTTN